MILQQQFVVEFIIANQQCDKCQQFNSDHTWWAVAQIRQKVNHKRTFLWLEQLIIRHNAHEQANNIKDQVLHHITTSSVSANPLGSARLGSALIVLALPYTTDSVARWIGLLLCQQEPNGQVRGIHHCRHTDPPKDRQAIDLTRYSKQRLQLQVHHIGRDCTDLQGRSCMPSSSNGCIDRQYFVCTTPCVIVVLLSLTYRCLAAGRWCCVPRSRESCTLSIP
jgi:hypothetical protein